MVTRINSFRRTVVIAAFASVPLVVSSALLAQSYTGPNGGSWDTPGNWTPNSVPNSASADVSVTNSATVVIPDGVTRTVNNLTIGALSGVTVGASSFFIVSGDLINAGIVTVTTGDSRLRTGGSNLSITGTGAIVLAGPSAAIDGGGFVTNGLGHTIRGFGNFGYNNTGLNNLGTVSANVSGQTLTLDPANAANTNAGLFVATNGGTLSLTGNGGGGFDNTGGIIRAEAGSTFSMVNSASVSNGTMTTTGDGAIRFSNTAYLTDVNSTGNLRINDSSFLVLGSTMVNSGTLTFDSTGGDTRLRTNGGNVSITGTGTIDMTAGGVIDGGARLSLSAGQTLIGRGNLGLNNTVFTNAGLVHANVSGEVLVIDPANTTDAFLNSGTMRASNGGRLLFTGNGGGDIVNNNLIQAVGTDSAVELTSSARIVGGTMTASGGGALRSLDGQTAYLQNTTISANSTFTTGFNSYTVIEGGITLNGTMNFKTAENTNQRIRTNGADVALNGSGMIVLDNTLFTNSDCVIDGGARVTIASTMTIRGSGSLGYNNTAFTNNGVVESDRGGMGLDPANTENGFLNNNIIRAVDGGSIILTGNGGGNFVQAANGVISATGTGVVEMTNSSRVVGGTLTTTSGGTMQSAAGQWVYLQNTTLSTGSTFSTGNNSYTVIEGSITNNGTITFNPAVAATNQRLRTNGSDVSIDGTGQIVLNNQSFAGSDMAIDGGARMTFGSGQIVRGSGSLGYNNTAFTNNGIVESAVGGIGIDPANVADAFLNNNIVRALSGGNITFTGSGGGDFVNTNGTLSADGTGVVALTTSARVVGGTLTTTNGGTMQSNDNQSVYLQNTTLSSGSTFTIGKGSWTHIEGSITNNGTITFRTDAATGQRLRTNGTDIAINGTGFIVLNNQVFAGSDMAIDGGGRVTFGSGQTVQGSGSLGYNNTVFTNNGVIESSIGGIGIDPANTADAFLNNGTLRANDGGNLTFTGSGGGGFTGTGPLVTNGTGSLVFTTSAQANMGPVSGTGTLTANNSSNVTFTSVRVGTLNIDSGALLHIAAGGGNAGTSSTSSLSINSGGNARLDMTDHAMIVEYTGATVADTIRGLLVSGRQGSGAWQGPGIMSSLASAANGKGVGYLESSQRFGVNGGNFYGQAADGTAILVAFTLNGDTDLDHDVDFNDLLRVAQNYGVATNRVWFNGDFNYSNGVDFNDLLPLAQNYGQALALTQSEEDALAGIAGTSFLTDWSMARSMVPEPATLGLLAGVTTLALRRRK